MSETDSCRALRGHQLGVLAAHKGRGLGLIGGEDLTCGVVAAHGAVHDVHPGLDASAFHMFGFVMDSRAKRVPLEAPRAARMDSAPVSYKNLRAHETVLDLVCRLLVEKKKT